MSKTKQIPNPFARKRTILIRVNEEELRAIELRARARTGGNLSGFVRDAALTYEPRKKAQK